MKLNFIFLFFLLIALIGCESQNNDQNNVDSSNNASEKAYYDINYSGERIKKDIDNMYAPMRLNAIRNQLKYNNNENINKDNDSTLQNRK